MSNSNMNKQILSFAQGKTEMERAIKFQGNSIDGKVRVCARRAVGFYLEGLLSAQPKPNYGKSFINHIKGLQIDKNVPTKIKSAAERLTLKSGIEDISASEAISNAQVIIEYCITEVNNK